MTLRLATALLLWVLAAAAPGARARAYVPARADSGAALRWMDHSCVALRANAAGSGDISDGSDIEAVGRAANNWQRATAHCSYIRFVLLPPSLDARPGFVPDSRHNENVVHWEEERWDYGPETVAMTVVFKQTTGRLLDADILVNGVDHRFSTTGARDRRDLESTLTHELGHLLGLDHPCVAQGDPSPWPEDHLGQLAPRCEDAPTEMVATTMYPRAGLADLERRSPEADDVLGICGTYPLSEDPGRCSAEAGAGLPDHGRGCACVTGRGPPRATIDRLLAVLLLAGLLLAGRCGFVSRRVRVDTTTRSSLVSSGAGALGSPRWVIRFPRRS